jgi:enterochelin esterase-like enzyme
MSDWDTFEAFLAEVQQEDDAKGRQDLVNVLLRQHPNWPWINGRRATFIHNQSGTQSAALNLDTIKADPPFAPMSNIDGTTLWYITYEFELDDLLDYLLAIDDPMTPLAGDPKIVERVTTYWKADPLNETRMKTAQLDVSVLRMPNARPFPDWSSMRAVPRGTVMEHPLSSRQLGFSDRRLWVYTPPGYNDNVEYPLLILMDALWCNGPLQVPYIADALIKHKRMQPAIIAMVQSPPQEHKPAEMISNDRHGLFLLSELLPFVKSHYSVDPLDVGIGGVGLAAVAAAHATLSNPTAFKHLIMISPPLAPQGKGEDSLANYRRRFETAAILRGRVFQAVGRYEAFARFLRPGRRLAEVIQRRGDVQFRFVEHGSGHGLVAFKGVFPEALAWVFPGEES